MSKIIVKMYLLSRLKNAEHFDLMEAIVTGVRAQMKNFPLLGGQWNTLEECFRREDEIYKSSQRVEETNVIEEADKKRARSTRRIRQFIASAAKSDNTAEREAAESLRFVVQLYKDATYAPYVENSALITNFLDDLLSEKHHEAVTQLNLQPLIDVAAEDNEAFKEIYRQRSIGAFEDIHKKLENARKETDAAFWAVCEAINNLYGVLMLESTGSEQVEGLQEIIRIVSSFLLNAERIYARRVPSYTMPKDDGSGESGPEEPNPYFFDVATETYQPDGYTIHFTDKNPEAFESHFLDVSLEDCLMYLEKEEMGKETTLFFKNYLYDSENNMIGLAIRSTRPMLSRRIIERDYTTSVLVRGNRILINFSEVSHPIYLD